MMKKGDLVLENEAPSQPPGNVVWNATDTKVLLNWEQVKAMENESEVTGYKVGLIYNLGHSRLKPLSVILENKMRDILSKFLIKTCYLVPKIAQGSEVKYEYNNFKKPKKLIYSKCFAPIVTALFGRHGLLIFINITVFNENLTETCFALQMAAVRFLILKLAGLLFQVVFAAVAWAGGGSLRLMRCPPPLVAAVFPYCLFCVLILDVTPAYDLISSMCVNNSETCSYGGNKSYIEIETEVHEIRNLKTGSSLSTNGAEDDKAI
eukprot:bmy_02950T0